MGLGDVLRRLLGGRRASLSLDTVKCSSAYEALADASTLVEVLGVPTEPESDKPARLLAYELTDLDLSSGQIVGSDAFVHDARPFTQRFKPGKYSLVLGVADFSGDERVAFALVRLVPVGVQRWELALTEGQDPAKLKPGEVYGYPVDSGTGCLADPGACQVLYDANDGTMALFDLITDEMDRVYKHTRSWVHVETPQGSAAMFSSGFGDGVYASYFGLNAQGGVVALVTDFGILDWPRRP